MSALLCEMDAAGISMGLVSGKAMSPGVPNEEVAQLCLDYRGRFIGAANVDPDGDPAESAALLRHCVQNLGMRGLVLETGLSKKGVTVDASSLYPVYEEAQNLQVPVFFTLSMFVGSDIGYCQQSLISLDRVAGDFPKLEFVVSHGGWPYVETAIGLALKRVNVYLSPDFYSMGFPLAQPYFVAANGFLQDQFIFGSAYPFFPLDRAVNHYREEITSSLTRDKVFFSTAARLLKLDVAH